MMSKVIYIGNIPFNATIADLREFCSSFAVVRVTIPVDREINRPRGFAFVELENDEQAQLAIEELDGMELGGRPVKISLARESRARNDRVRGSIKVAKEEEDFGKIWRE